MSVHLARQSGEVFLSVPWVSSCNYPTFAINIIEYLVPIKILTVKKFIYNLVCVVHFFFLAFVVHVAESKINLLKRSKAFSTLMPCCNTPATLEESLKMTVAKDASDNTLSDINQVTPNDDKVAPHIDAPTVELSIKTSKTDLEGEC